jgi:hypothetical protein
MQNRTMKTRNISHTMGGDGHQTARALLDFISRGQRAQEAVDRIIEAEKVNARQRRPRR